MKYGCHSDRVGPGPRGRPRTSLMQSGWRIIRLVMAKQITREPAMVEVTTTWKALTCGHKQQQGQSSDPGCAGCENQQW